MNLSQKILRNIIFGILLLPLLLISFLFWGVLNSYYRDTIQSIKSPDTSKVLTIKVDMEDDPYYVFELTRNFALGYKHTEEIGNCIPYERGQYYKVLRWKNNCYFELGLLQE